jgi:hypothetical protein
MENLVVLNYWITQNNFFELGISHKSILREISLRNPRLKDCS